MKRCILLLSVFAGGLAGQIFTPPNPAAQAARQWREQHESAIVDEFVTLLSIPNIAADRANIQRNAEMIAAMMQKRGIASKLIAVPGANPVVFGEIKTPGATRSIVFYAHYDGQPLDPKEWATPPFTPTLKDGRIYARSAGDDKAPIMALMAAVDAIRSARLMLKSNIKFAFEGEEEVGSPHL